MAEGKKGFILYADQEAAFKLLSNEQAGILIKHIYDYVNDRDPVLEDETLKIIFALIKVQLKRDLEKWENSREKRKDAGKKGGVKSAESRTSKQTEAKPSNASNSKQNQAMLEDLSKSKQSQANQAVIVNDKVKVKGKVINIDINDLDAGNTVEYCSITLHRQYTTDRIRELWRAFIIQNSSESYHAEKDRLKHFREWIKFQPYSEEKTHNGKPINKNAFI